MQRSHSLSLAAVVAIAAVLVYAFMSRDSSPQPRPSTPPRESAVLATPSSPSPTAPAPVPERAPGSVSTADLPAAQSFPVAGAPPRPSTEPRPPGPPANPNSPPPGPVSDPNMLSSTKLPAGQGHSPELEQVRSMLRDFRTIEGENPVGTNAEIAKALMGGNKKGAQLAGEAKLNGNGELVDEWGTPYFFHQLSKLEMEIRSAGPDGELWTPDDRVTK